MKNIKEDAIKLVAKNPRKIKAALKAWILASDKINSDPLGLDDAPQWVENAWAEVIKVVMPGNRLPTSGEWDMELLGNCRAGSKPSQIVLRRDSNETGSENGI